MLEMLMGIKGWIAGLDLWDKTVGGVVSFVTGGVLKRLLDKFRPSEEDRAFKKAVKRWNSSSYIRGYYKQNKLKTIREFCDYVVGHHGAYDDDIDRLYRLFEEELSKSNEGKLFLQNLRLKALNKDVYGSLMGINNLLNEQKALHQMLEDINRELCSHNRGIREFSVVDGYIQRYCSLRLKSQDYFTYIIEHKGVKRHKLADIVTGKTECKGNKFVLYSDAQTGKTTELLRLGWELQEEKKLIPIMFKIRGSLNIKHELPALRAEIEKGLVVIIDALDEKFEGDARFAVYREIENYAEEHPHLRIVMTCRANFSGEFKFENFTELNLTDLSWQDSMDYLRRVSLENIIPEIEKRKLYEFVRTPFYLMALVDYYKEKHVLPENKGVLYDFFIDRRLAQEERLSLKEDAEMLRKGKKLLQKMAVAIQLMGLNHIGKDNLLDLLGSKYDDYNRILRSGLIEVEKDGYGFTHNAFKEYFVSRYLLTIGNLEAIQKLCCYKGTKIIRTGWNNTIALLLAQLPKESMLSKQILEWIVKDNKDLVLCIDRKLLDEKKRTSIFKDILEWHKSKNLRFADYGTSLYEDLMEFGRSAESITYLMVELENIGEIDCHAVNVLFLLRHVRQEDINAEKTIALEELLLKKFEEFKNDDEHIYIFFEVLRNKWLQTEEIADAVYHILKDSEHPNIVNHFVDYVTETGLAEKYADVIIEKGKYIKSYGRDGYTRVLRKDNLYDAYLAMTSWMSIKKALIQLKTEYLEHLVSSMDEEKHEEVMGKLFEKVAGMSEAQPEASDFIYEMLLEMAEDRSTMRKMGKDIFKDYFDNVDLSQHYFEESVKTLKGYFLDNTIEAKTYDDHRRIESNAYCAALLLDESRLEQILSLLDFSNPNGDCLLTCLSQFATEEMHNEINVIKKNRYPQYWRDPDAPQRWELEAQREYDELMDYERFKGKALQILAEKAPNNRDEMRALRHAKIKFTDKEEESISRYVCSLFYEYYDSESDSYDLQGIKEFVENYACYQRLVVLKTEEFLYGNYERIKLSAEQRKLFKNCVVHCLQELATEPYYKGYAYKHPAVTVLLHHDVEVDDSLLLQLLPYSSCDIYIREEGYNGRNYSLFAYISERCGKRPEFLTALRGYMDSPVEYVDSNWKIWCVYLVKERISSEYQRAINQMLSLPCEDPSLSIAVALLENDETRPMVLTGDVLGRCDEEKRLFIYEQLSSDASMDSFVKEGIERDFEKLNDGNKQRAVRIMLMKGSVMGLKYAEKDPSVIDIRSNVRNYNVDSLPLLMSVYSKAIEKLHRSDYSGILKAVEYIAEATDEGWEKVNQLFDNLILQDQKKFQHLNWYLRDWSVKRMEKASPVMSLEKVKELLVA